MARNNLQYDIAIQAYNYLIENKDNFYQRLSKIELVKVLKQKVESKNISKPIFNLLMGDICQIKAEWDNALIYYKKASEEIENKNIKAEGLVKNGEIHFRKGLLDEALLYFEKGLEFSKENSFCFKIVLFS